MQQKSKKPIIDKQSQFQKQQRYLVHSSSTPQTRLNLSLSFYGQATLKMQKQFIMDSYDDLQNNLSTNILDTNTTFYSFLQNSQSTTSLIDLDKQHQEPIFVKKNFGRTKQLEIKDLKNNYGKQKIKCTELPTQQKKKTQKSPPIRTKLIVTSKPSNSPKSPLLKVKSPQNAIQPNIKQKISQPTNTIPTIKQKKGQNVIKSINVKSKICVTKKI